jgi:hypothetical protein
MKLNETAFDFANADRADEIYHTEDARAFIADYLMWASRCETNEMGVNRNFLAAVSEHPDVWRWKSNLVGGFDTLAEAEQAAEQRGAKLGHKFARVLDVETGEWKLWNLTISTAKL